MAGTVQGWTPKAKNESAQQDVIRVKADLYWAQLSEKNEMSGKYQVDLCNLSDAAAQKLSDAGVEVKTSDKEDDTRGAYVTAKSANPIFAFDTERNRIHENIGNGSKADVVLTTYNWDFKGKTGTSASIRHLTITDLIEFDRDGGGNIDFDSLPEAI